MDRGAWWATVHRIAEFDPTEATQHGTAKEHGDNLKVTQSVSFSVTSLSHVRSSTVFIGYWKGISDYFFFLCHT